jgi:tyrosyl-tRNA synthetase
MKSGDGMSYAEFTYPILQAWDWWHMFNTKGISMQIGGADQYGNIIAGQEAVKYITANHPDPKVRNDHVGKVPMGFTVPLLTTAAGAKFGKSAGNAVWLDKELTSCYDLYGFFLRQADADMPRFLRFFTFMPIAEIDALVEEHNRQPHLRLAQHKLASEFLELVHGPEEMKIAAEQHRMIHGEPLTIQSLLEPANVDPKNAHITMNSAPIKRMKLPESVILNKSIGRIAHAAGLATSASEGHRLAEKGGLYIGATPGQKKAMNDAELKFTPIRNWYVEDSRKFLIENKLLILRKGKNLVKIVEVVSDEEWKESGETYPGEALAAPDRTQASEAIKNKPVEEIEEERSQSGKKKSLWSQFAPEREERAGRPREKVEDGGNVEWAPFLKKVKTKGTPVESSRKPEEKTIIRKIQSEGKWALPGNKASGDKW